MATNPIGKGTQTIGLNMSKKMADELEKRSASMHSNSKFAIHVDMMLAAYRWGVEV